MTMAAQVSLVFNEGRRQRFVDLPAVKRKEYTCGRQDEKVPDILLEGLTTSRQHARIKLEGGQVAIKDIGSTHGTYVDEEKLERERWKYLKPNQKIRFGTDDPGVDLQGHKFDIAVLVVNNCVAKGLAPAATIPRAASAAQQQANPQNGVQERRQSQAAPAAPIGPQLPRASVGSHPSRASVGPQQPSRASIGPQLPPRSQGGPPMGPRREADNDEDTEQPRGVKRSHETSGKQETCDKCDGKHPTDMCPHFKKKRENHKDAWQNYGCKNPLSMGRASQRFILRRGRVVPQPGDGSCLFHSLCFGLNGGRSHGKRADQLRRELMGWISKNEDREISGDTLEEWIKWDARTSVTQYTRRMSVSGWGGGIEMAACSIMNNINVHVYESRRHGEFERISCFDAPSRTERTIHVLYKGGMHFDAILAG